MAAAEIGGGRGPVRFDVPPLRSPGQAAAPEQPPQPQPVAPAEPSRQNGGGFWGFLQRLLGSQRPASAPSPAQAAHREKRDRAQREWEQRWERTCAIMIPALLQIGGRRVYCRYDGGNDEGFAWFDSLELQDNQRIDLNAVARRLYDIQVHETLRAADVELRDPFMLSGSDSPSEQGAVKSFVELLCNDWATLLLGRGYGTGEYSMFGAFTVDLEARTITDDPRADPVVQNISIGQ
jgi:hypothetical protein